MKFYNENRQSWSVHFFLVRTSIYCLHLLALEYEIDCETVIMIDNIEKLTLFSKWKQKLLFLKEREKLLQSNDNSSIAIVGSSPSSTLDSSISASLLKLTAVDNESIGDKNAYSKRKNALQVKNVFLRSSLAVNLHIRLHIYEHLRTYIYLEGVKMYNKSPIH